MVGSGKDCVTYNLFLRPPDERVVHVVRLVCPSPVVVASSFCVVLEWPKSVLLQSLCWPNIGSPSTECSSSPFCLLPLAILVFSAPTPQWSNPDLVISFGIFGLSCPFLWNCLWLSGLWPHSVLIWIFSRYACCGACSSLKKRVLRTSPSMPRRQRWAVPSFPKLVYYRNCCVFLKFR